MITHRSLTLRESRRTSANLLESRDQTMVIAGTRAFWSSVSSPCCPAARLVLILLLLLLLLLLLALLQDFALAAAVAVVLLAIGRELRFDDRRVVGLLQRLCVVVGVHHVEVVIAANTTVLPSGDSDAQRGGRGSSL